MLIFLSVGLCCNRVTRAFRKRNDRAGHYRGPGGGQGESRENSEEASRGAANGGGRGSTPLHSAE
eukprot:1176339-Prorocentrum_minimum.AAC.3